MFTTRDHASEGAQLFVINQTIKLNYLEAI